MAHGYRTLDAAIDWPSELENLESGPPFFLATPKHTLLASRAGAEVFGCAAEPQELLARAHFALKRKEPCPELLVGALPFDLDRPAQLFRPAEVISTGPFLLAPDARSPDSGFFRTMSIDSPQEDFRFTSGVVQALRHIARGELDKVVLAQTLELDLSVLPHIGRLLLSLRSNHPHGYAYAMRGVESTLVGSSPELLVSRSGNEVRSTPLAGSRPLPSSKDGEERAIDELLSSEKDLWEHRLVVEQIASQLRPFVCELNVSKPVIFKTATMLHLGTHIVGSLRSPDTNALTLALALHPTPAVCGLPVEAARRFIKYAEGTDRGLFGGTLGYMNARGDGVWIVTIRCAEVSSTSARLFAGAGIVQNSEPQSELLEVKSKMATLLRSLREVL